MKNERGVAYLSTIFTVVALFIWITFELERTVQNQQTVEYNYHIVQAQYLAESSIEKLRTVLMEDPQFNGQIHIRLTTGQASASIINHRPLQLQGVGKVNERVQQTVYVELDQDSYNIIKWWR